MSDSDSECGNINNPDTFTGLRVASVFVTLVCATGGTLFPILAKRSTWLHLPKSVFDFAKYFGSGVIIATAFIHLLSPALDELSSDCLSPEWSEYPYALALCLLSIMSIFILELIAFRWGTSRLQKIHITHDAHGHEVGSHAAHGPEHSSPTKAVDDPEAQSIDLKLDDSAAAQIIGIAILEFGVLLHSVLIGLTLAVDEGFKILFVVIIFHQTFEGLGLGSRLAFIKLPPRYNFVPIAAALIYGISTPIGIAVGLGIRSTYNPGSATASIVSGVLDSLSAGILMYTGLVELLAHEFLFNKEMVNSSNGKLAYAIGSMLFGCGIMALLGKWA
ncbi:ZIP-like iron-zinc transporter [Mycena olivaceomarginata]|nr:ZIP-like iron-zinc transporter [Mycena olivaceomarginata]